MASFKSMSLVDKQKDEQQPECYEICIENIEQQHFKHLIGKEGSRIKEIKLKFNYEVEIEIVEKRIYVSGSDQNNIIDCERLMNELLDEFLGKGFLSRNSVENHFKKIREKHSDNNKLTKKQKQPINSDCL